MEPEVETFGLAPDGDIPNNALPLLLYRHALPPELQSPSACQALFARNLWRGNWVDGIFDYWHFHTTGHEVLGCVAGSARVGFGGDHGTSVEFRAGDVVVIPAGVGHKRFGGSVDFCVIGGYPPGQNGTITRPGEISREGAEATIRALGLPQSDPLFGNEGPLIETWGIR